jgi:hypothetical protein
MSIQHCRECGSQVTAAAKFCPDCGVRSPAAGDPLAALGSGAGAPKQQTVIVRRKSRRDGLLTGVFACLFGALGIFTLGIIFVPLAALCSVIGLLLGLAGRSSSGLAVSTLGAGLTVIGFVASPSLWLLVGGLLVASKDHLPAATANPKVPISVTASNAAPATADAKVMTMLSSSEAPGAQASKNITSVTSQANPSFTQPFEEGYPTDKLVPWRNIRVLNDPTTQLVVEGEKGKVYRIPGGVRVYLLNGEKGGPAVNICRALEKDANLFLRCDRKRGFRDGPSPRPWWWRYEAVIEGSTVKIVSVSQKDGPFERGERVSEHFYEDIKETDAR